MKSLFSRFPKILFYSLAGVTAALFAWNIALLFLVYPIKFILTTISQNQIPSNLENILFHINEVLLPEIVLFPIVAVVLSVSLVYTAIYLSNPTHDKANKRNRKDYVYMALKMGIVTGGISAIVILILYQLISGSVIRVVSWLIIGLGIGLAEGLCWYFLTTEGSSSLTKNRLIKSPMFGGIAGFIAALLIESIPETIKLGGYEEPLGFIILGTCLGLSLTFSTTPAYQVALRAGRGFAISDENVDNQKPYPKIIDSQQNSSGFTFVPFKYIETRQTKDLIEEGLSIQLPTKNNFTIVIGSAKGSHICLPETPAKVAELILENKQWKIKCLAKSKVKIQAKYLLENSRPQPLHHNQILTFYYEQEKDKFYRFIFYDRFLDPST
ncbi:hypothetical protein [Crocosphaera sp.]|uniref:hypothetical protein n=1 Tax=Crocosphaera sp. TaxID=2729996 RepID=UPI0026121BD8|nr:hypothetical protein [Crocosphaera sp.]MDJ0581077.1 hypothetical protein [Crocosphaera sp.]